jgi:predicted phage tail protein
MNYRAMTPTVNMHYGPPQAGGPIYINPNDLPLGSHTFKVQAYNMVGSGPWSEPSNVLTKAIAPFAPTSVAATAGVGRAYLHISGASDAGSPITGYTVTSSPGNITASVGAAQIVEIAGLARGTTYTFTAKAINAEGTSPASPASNSITTPTIPGAPTNVSVRAGNGEAAVAFTASASDGGSPVTGYDVYSRSGGSKRSTVAASGTASPITVKGLANGTAYTFTVTARNAVGSSPPAESPSVTPRDPKDEGSRPSKPDPGGTPRPGRPK